MMKPRQPHEPRTRGQEWQHAAFLALIACVIALMVLKFMIGIAFGAAFIVAVGAFLLFLAMAMRMTPHRD